MASRLHTSTHVPHPVHFEVSISGISGCGCLLSPVALSLFSGSLFALFAAPEKALLRVLLF
jgi:hypothetical protein